MTGLGGELELELLVLVLDCQAGLGRVHSVAAVWLGHWVGDGCAGIALKSGAW